MRSDVGGSYLIVAVMLVVALGLAFMAVGVGRWLAAENAARRKPCRRPRSP